MTTPATPATIGTNTDVPEHIRVLRERLENALDESLTHVHATPRSEGIDVITSVAAVMLTYHLPVVRDVIDSGATFQSLLTKLRAANKAYDLHQYRTGEPYDKTAMLKFITEFMVPEVWPGLK